MSAFRFIAALLLALMLWPSTAAAQDDDTSDRPLARNPENGSEEEAPDQDGPQMREKPLRTTVGLAPTAVDLGSEADIFGLGPREEAEELKRWKLNLKAFLRATARVSYGQRNDETSGSELHAPPRVSGLSSGDWAYVGVAPSPSAKLYLNASNALVSGNIILSGQPPIDPGYPNLAEMGWFVDAYLTLKFPTVFGNRGGLAWTVGTFSNRYGNAGPKSTGYYNTYLFGKTHVMGEALTLDLDLTPEVELVLEHGIGAKLDVIPFLREDPVTVADPDRPEGEYLQGQGATPRGSNFVHHAHASLEFGYWLRLGAHYLTSWSPNDRSFARGVAEPEARLTIFGGDLHLDLATGNGYLGYSRVKATDIQPLDNGVQVIHASRGSDFKKIYLGEKNRTTGIEPSNDSGTVDTLLFQYLLRLGNIIRSGPELDVALYSMFAHVRSPSMKATDIDIDENRLKFGVELQAPIFRFMSGAFRFDRVSTNLDNPEAAYSAFSPRLSFYSKRDSKEYIIVSYTHFRYGSDVYAGSPYRALNVKPDPHLFAVSAVMSL